MHTYLEIRLDEQSKKILKQIATSRRKSQAAVLRELIQAAMIEPAMSESLQAN